MEGATGGQNAAMNPAITINATSSEPEAIAEKVRAALQTKTSDFLTAIKTARAEDARKGYV